MEGIDPEFLAALPPDMQAEVLEQQRLDRRRRQLAAQQEAAIAVRLTICIPYQLFEVARSSLGLSGFALLLLPSSCWHAAEMQKSRSALQESIASAC